MSIRSTFSKQNVQKKWREWVFLFVVLALPVTQFVLMYLCVNVNSILLAFKRYDNPDFVWNGLNNFKDFFRTITTIPYRIRIKNSLILYLVGVFISTPIAIFISYVLWRKVWGYKFFQVVLFLPTIISAIVFVVLAKNYIYRVLPYVFHAPKDLLSNPATGFQTVVIYGILIGFGAQIVMYLGSLSSVNESVVEYAKLDGMNFFQEFIYVAFPKMYGTLATYLVVGVAGFFTNYAQLYSFFSWGAANEFQTLGYYYFAEVVDVGRETAYCSASAAGVVFTMIALPATIGMRKLTYRLQPKEE